MDLLGGGGLMWGCTTPYIGQKGARGEQIPIRYDSKRAFSNTNEILNHWGWCPETCPTSPRQKGP